VATDFSLGPCAKLCNQLGHTSHESQDKNRVCPAEIFVVIGGMYEAGVLQRH
jgi:hypothetical protein